MYKVSAKIGGKRVVTDVTFKTKAEATKYANDTKKYHKGSNPRVIKA